jgi:pyridoxine kinase
MRETIAHWRSLELRFDALYSGFLSSPEQIQIAAELIDGFSDPQTGALVLVDPVLGDNGQPYGPVRPELIQSRRGSWAILHAPLASLSCQVLSDWRQ